MIDNENSSLYEKFKDLNQTDLNEAFFSSCKQGDLNEVRYLLASPDLKRHANIHAFGGVGIKWACSKNQLKLVQYLLTSPELSQHADIHADNDYGFQTACAKKHWDVIKFLIFDMNIEKTEAIKKYFKEISNKEIEYMFEIRDLKDTLNEELPYDFRQNKRIKI